MAEKGLIDPKWHEFRGLHSLLYVGATNAAARIKGGTVAVEHPLPPSYGPEHFRMLRHEKDMRHHTLAEQKAWCESALRQAGHRFVGEEKAA